MQPLAGLFSVRISERSAFSLGAPAVIDLAALNGATVAFDLDGTLVETAPDLIASLNAVLIAEGFEPLPYTQGRPLIGRGARWLLQSGLAAAGESNPADRADALFEQFIDHYRAHIADESRAFPGVVSALETLKSNGAKLVVCTNKRTDLSCDLLEKLDMARLFDGIVGADAVSESKPNAAHLIEAVAAVHGDLARTVMVGDAATDAGCARAAGRPLILVDFGYTETPATEHTPDILLRHFDDLVMAIVRLLEPNRPLLML